MLYLLCLVLFLIQAASTSAQSCRPIAEMVDTCGNTVAPESDSFALYESNSGKWLSIGSGWWAELGDTAAYFKYQAIQSKTETSLGCRIHNFDYGYGWYTFKEQRRPGGAWILSNKANGAFGKYHSSLICQVESEPGVFYMGAGGLSCDGHGCVGPTMFRAGSDKYVYGREWGGALLKFYAIKVPDGSVSYSATPPQLCDNAKKSSKYIEGSCDLSK
ncbi:hypothetical protein GQ42DRAFT_170330 [Ramicandelaber brevisporus]|nr:hypothetical protein GQ42DRAFT_170330 [Ramicandelaber brevisporus]